MALSQPPDSQSLQKPPSPSCFHYNSTSLLNTSAQLAGVQHEVQPIQPTNIAPPLVAGDTLSDQQLSGAAIGVIIMIILLLLSGLGVCI